MHELESWAEEKRSAYLYRVVAEAEAGTPRQALFNELARSADNQAAIWERLARDSGQAVPDRFVPDLRARVVAYLVRRLGPRPLRGVLAAIKVRGMSLYTGAASGHPMPSSVADVGARHRGVATGGNLRAAVFGVNDGLISNASLILGIAGATSDNALILLSGAAGLIAGAFSMAAGEYVSVRSQREMFEYQIGLEKEELEQYPEEEAEELALIYEARGLPREEAVRLANTLTADPEKALETLAREELGLNPEDLGSPWGGGAVLVFLVRGGRRDSVAALFARERHGQPCCRHRADRYHVVRGRRHALAFHRARRGLQRRAHAGDRRGCRRRHLRDRQAARGDVKLISGGSNRAYWKNNRP